MGGRLEALHTIIFSKKIQSLKHSKIDMKRDDIEKEKTSRFQFRGKSQQRRVDEGMGSDMYSVLFG